MKVSIITVCRNAEKTISKTINSVISQTYNDIEYIVIDGRSGDKTQSILRKYQKHIDILISEQDNGIYDAMNKGINKSSGEWIYFLNSGDTFVNNEVVECISKQINRDDNAEILYGNVVMIKKGKKQLNKNSNVNRGYLIKNTICHQAMFTKRSLYQQHGLFDIKYSIAADYDWLLRVHLVKNVHMKYIDLDIANYPLLGISSDRKFRQFTLSEYSNIRNKYFSKTEVIVYEIYIQLLFILVKLKEKIL